MSVTRIGLVLGDPAGVGPEISAKLLAREAASEDTRFTVFATERVLSEGARIAGVVLDVPVAKRVGGSGDEKSSAVLVPIDDSEATEIPSGTASRAAGLYTLRSLDAAVRAAKAGEIDAIVYAPLNKHAMHLAGFDEIDEMHYLARQFGCNHFCSELNLLDNLWTVRATSHVPIRDIASRLSKKLVIDATELGVATMKRAGVDNPRIAIAGLNPHASDGGTIGDEEAEIIAPAIEALSEKGLDVHGPMSPDTVFMVAHKGVYDLVVTMYHDQGQIALKSLGFERLVTLLGGLPVPAITASSGSAYDITGKNKASAEGLIAACALARRLTAPQARSDAA